MTTLHNFWLHPMGVTGDFITTLDLTSLDELRKPELFRDIQTNQFQRESDMKWLPVQSGDCEETCIGGDQKSLVTNGMVTIVLLGNSHDDRI